MSGRWAQRPKAGSDAELVTYQNAVEVQDWQHHDSSAVLAASNDLPLLPHYPAHFTKGSIIHLATGELKRIEDLSTDDFRRSADMSKDLCIDTSVVRGITPVAERGTVMLEFSVGQSQVQASCLLYISYIIIPRRSPAGVAENIVMSSLVRKSICMYICVYVIILQTSRLIRMLFSSVDC